jgi:hypothetical protein
MPIRSQIFGDFIEPCAVQDALWLTFSSSQLPLHNRWLNNSLSARFVADYCSTFFPIHPQSAVWSRHEIHEIVNYIVNELLDNAVKYGWASPPTAPLVTLQLCILNDVLRLYVSNPIHPRIVGSFQVYVQHLLTHDPATLYFQQMEGNAREGVQVSRLGLLSMLHDYHAQLAWKFVAPEPPAESLSVTIMVQFPSTRFQEGLEESRAMP